MATTVPTNPDLPSSILLPGVYFSLNLRGSGGGLSLPSKRLNLVGCKTSSGTAPQDTPLRVSSQSDANTYFGRGSDLARMFAAAMSQTVPGAVDINCLPIVEPTGGTAATHLITLGGTATTSGSVTVTICGYTCSTAFANGDTSATVAANLNTQIATLLDMPCTTGVASSTITLTYRHKGLQSNDLPRIVNIVGSGITASPGTITFATNATGAGTVATSISGTTVSAAISNADTPTVAAAALTTALNAGGYPVTATSSVGAVTLYYVNDRVVHRINGAVITSTGMTATTACGTIGAGNPTMTTALSNMAAQGKMPVWCSGFNDSNATAYAATASGGSFHGGVSSNTLKTIQTHLELYSDGYNQKGQVLFWGASEALAVAGSYQTGGGFNTSTNGRYGAEIWQVDSPQQAYELAARAACARVVEDYLPKNYAGTKLKTSGTVPLLQPHKAVRSPQSDNNSAILSYYMTPLGVDESANAIYIVRDRTTSSDTDQRTWSWGAIATLDYIRSDLGDYLGTLFAGKSYKPSGNAPRTPNAVTNNSIKEATAERLRSYDSVDFVDSVDDLVKGLSANQDAIVTTRVDMYVPLRIPVPLYQIAGTLNLT